MKPRLGSGTLGLACAVFAGVSLTWWYQQHVPAFVMSPTQPALRDVLTPQSAPKSFAPEILGALSADASAEQLVERIHGLSENLPEAGQKVLLDWIQQPRPAHIAASKWHWVINEVMGALRIQKAPHPGLATTLIAISRNQANGVVLRDYALQHLAHWILPGRPAEPRDKNARQEIVTAFMDAAREVEQTFSGTALRSLHVVLAHRGKDDASFSNSFNEPALITVETIRPLAIDLATSASTNPVARITALQVCSELRFVEVLPAARRFASGEDAPISVRLSAIALLGAIGEAEDTAILSAISTKRYARLEKARTPALSRIRARVQSKATTLSVK
ncbi:MAG: hypothetical protein V4710_15445 [Verrucomicrobiota bacterium]